MFAHCYQLPLQWTLGKIKPQVSYHSCWASGMGHGGVLSSLIIHIIISYHIIPNAMWLNLVMLHIPVFFFGQCDKPKVLWSRITPKLLFS